MRFRQIFTHHARWKMLCGWVFLLLLLAAPPAGAQQVSLDVNGAPIETVFTLVKKQSGFTFLYTSEELKNAKPVTVSFRNWPMEKALETIFAGQPLSYSVDQTYVVVRAKPQPPAPERQEVSGRVTDEGGAPIPNVSVTVRGTSEGTTTGADGSFTLRTGHWPLVLRLSAVGFQPQELTVTNGRFVAATLQMAVSKLDEQVIIAYGSTTRRLNTGSVSRIKAEEIEKQPVSNPLAALIGRIPGLVVTQSSGISGGSFKLQIRGQNSIAQGNDPLIIVDGVPLAAGNANLNQVGAAFSFSGNGLSPFNSLNPADIESVEVLKDADATAIYGSRGANGVILITSKKGTPGKTKISASLWSGWSRAGRTMSLLNTSQYLTMRREAFANDGINPTTSNAYDLLVWDTTRYTDLKDLLIGGTAAITDAQVSLTGGTQQTSLLLNAGFHREGSVYANSLADQRGSLHFHVQHRSADNRLVVQLQGLYTIGKNDLLTADLTNLINQPPNLPPLYDSIGNLNWSQGGFNFTNPLSYLRLSYTAKTNNLVSSLVMNYKILKNLEWKTNLGYNAMTISEVSTRPISAQNPAFYPTGSSQFGNTSLQSLIVEPQLEYVQQVLGAHCSVLAGATWQQNTSDIIYIYASGYVNDALIRSTEGAGSIYSSTNFSQYKYAAAFGRIHFDWQNKYLLNLTARRDGSSRFGPANRYANFGAVGAGWVFTRDSFLRQALPFLSFGKVRASYGTAGNDAIGDYKYLDTYSSAIYPYQGVPGINPTGLFNPSYGWEKSRKFEAAIELGFWKNRLLITASYYNNKSTNQLVQYGLPSQTGFVSVTANLPATVQNSGVEFEAIAGLIKSRGIDWELSFNLSVPRNKLLEYPGLENSTYRNSYLIGQPITIGNGYQLIGVDPATGIYQFLDKAGHPTFTPFYPTDIVKGLVVVGPDYLGGLKNAISYKGIQLDCFLEYRKQIGFSYLRDITIPPGVMRNQPTVVMNRWQSTGDLATIQRFTTSYNNQAYTANNLIASYGATNLYENASYIRLKNLSLAYTLPNVVINSLSLSSVRVYLQAQNLATFTSYRVGDPETQHPYYLPPLKTITAGIQLSF